MTDIEQTRRVGKSLAHASPDATNELILRAMREDHAALVARTREARLAHEDMAKRLRHRADALRAHGLGVTDERG